MNSKRKGTRGENELRDLLRAAGYASAHRNDQRYVGGLDNPDVSGIPGYHLEVKRCERLSLYEAYEQAARDANGKAVPVVVHRRNHKPWLVILRLDDWLSGRGLGDFHEQGT